MTPEDGEPEVIFCLDEFGPLNLQPRPGRQWAAVSGKRKQPGRAPRRRMRATYTRTAGVRHLFAAYELGEDKLFGHIKPRKTRGRFLEFCRYLRSLYPSETRIAIVCDNFSPHLTTTKDRRVGEWAKTSNVEIAYTPTNSSWLNRVQAQFTALRYFALDGTDHATGRRRIREAPLIWMSMRLTRILSGCLTQSLPTSLSSDAGLLPLTSAFS